MARPHDAASSRPSSGRRESRPGRWLRGACGRRPAAAQRGDGLAAGPFHRRADRRRARRRQRAAPGAGRRCRCPSPPTGHEAHARRLPRGGDRARWCVLPASCAMPWRRSRAASARCRPTTARPSPSRPATRAASRSATAPATPSSAPAASTASRPGTPGPTTRGPATDRPSASTSRSGKPPPRGLPRSALRSARGACAGLRRRLQPRRAPRGAATTNALRDAP